MTETVYFDTDCLSAFLWVNNQSILAQLYPGRIVLPKEVYIELSNPGIPHLKARVEIVRGLYGVMERDRIDKGVIVTTSQFTRDAVREAEMLNGRIKLVDYQELQRLMRR